MANLAEALALLPHLTHEELRDLEYEISYRLAWKQESAALVAKDYDAAAKAQATLARLREGRKGIREKKSRREYSETMNAARDQTVMLSNDDQQTVAQMARALKQALAPVEGRRTRRSGDRAGEKLATGTVEAKQVHHPAYDLETGARRYDDQGRPLSYGFDGIEGYAPEIPGWGPYLYIRVWATGGGKNRDQKQHRSKYVGHKDLAQVFVKMEPGSPERREFAQQIIEHYLAKTLHQLVPPELPAADAPQDDQPDQETDE